MFRDNPEAQYCQNVNSPKTALKRIATETISL